MIVYQGSLEDARELAQFVRRETANLRALRKLVITRTPFDVSLSVPRGGGPRAEEIHPCLRFSASV